MKKKVLFLTAGILVLSVSASPVLASDPPEDDYYYDDYYYDDYYYDDYNYEEDNYYQDEDTGEWMESNNAGWTEEEGYFEPHYFYEDGSVWFEDATGIVYIGSQDQYYIDDNGQLMENQQTAPDTSQNSGQKQASDSSSKPEENAEPEKKGELHMVVSFPVSDFITDSMVDGKGGYSETRSVNEGKSMAVLIKLSRAETEAASISSPRDFMAQYYPIGDVTTEEETAIDSYPATHFQYESGLNEDAQAVDALVCQTDEFTFGLFILTPLDNYDKDTEKYATELIKSVNLVYAENIDMAMTDYFQVLTPERWKYLCRYETTPTENGGYVLTYYNGDTPVLTLEARHYDGTDQPLDSVWQSYLGRIANTDGSQQYDLLATISQYSEDASDEWKEMYDTYEDVINGIRIMDGYALTAGSHA